MGFDLLDVGFDGGEFFVEYCVELLLVGCKYGLCCVVCGLEFVGKLLLMLPCFLSIGNCFVEFDFGVFEFEGLLLDLSIEVGLVFEFGFGDVELLAPVVMLCVVWWIASICVCFCWAAAIDSLRSYWISPVWMSFVIVCLICSVSCVSVGRVLVLVDGVLWLYGVLLLVAVVVV